MAKFIIDFHKNKKQAAIAITVITVVMLVGYLYLLLIPQIASAAGALRDASRLQADVRAAEQDIARLDVVKKELAGYNDKIERYVKMLPMETEIPALLENLAVMARSAAVKIVAITPVPGKEMEGQKGRIYQETPIQISARCGYHELGAFLTSIEGSDRFMKVVDINIKGTPASPKKHDVDLVLLTYVLLRGK